MGQQGHGDQGYFEVRDELGKRVEKLRRKHRNLSNNGPRSMTNDRLRSMNDAEKLTLHLRMAAMELDPLERRTRRKRAIALGLSLQQYFYTRKDPLYVSRKNALLKQFENIFAGDIQRKLIDKCLEGSVKHMALFYTRRGELVNKVEHSRPGDIPDDPAKVDGEIEQLLLETNPLATGAVDADPRRRNKKNR